MADIQRVPVKYDFDRIIDRCGTYSIKHDPEAYGMPGDILPMWVADMDFQTPPCVTAVLEEQVKHGIFGYSKPDSGYYDAVERWFERRFGWKTEREWLVITQGIVNAIYIAIRALTGHGDGVVIQQPVYHPFEHAVKQTGRRLLVNELIYNGGRYSIDFDDFEDKIKQAKLFILCSPHNPVGRVWTRDELTRMGDICIRHSVKVISDEIHQDFIYPDHNHHVFAGIDPCFADLTVTCTAPSKTFNLAGLPLSNIFIRNNEIRASFAREYENCGLGDPGVMSIVACKAAYGGGEEWLEELIDYLTGNMSLIREFLRKRVPKVQLVEPEGTYLAWLDCTKSGLSANELNEVITQKARLWLNRGDMFGSGGAGFQRLNTACPRSVLSEALERLETAFS